eukprot:TRINITY_DN1334_c0_g1_i1.p1 TRINITY_DN1334_c0_g1~~TRINITY_DN1334_c0_g1_i1.p1  ORF type:complete len:386 (-),score=135.80 TRINITY_DN1334_c0_g1_i1:15-1172(-)
MQNLTKKEKTSLSKPFELTCCAITKTKKRKDVKTHKKDLDDLNSKIESEEEKKRKQKLCKKKVKDYLNSNHLKCSSLCCKKNNYNTLIEDTQQDKIDLIDDKQENENDNNENNENNENDNNDNNENENNINELNSDDEGPPKTDTWKLYSITETPNYLRSAYILNGYRVHFSLRLSLLSVIKLHNETWNVWTHLIGFFFFFGIMLYSLTTWLANGDWVDKIMFSIWAITAQVMLACSTIFHTCNCMSKSAFSCTAKLDYSGISALIVGSYYPLLYYVFYCNRTLQIAYTASITVLGLITLFISFIPFFQQPKYSTVRALTFIGIGAFALAIFPHAFILIGFHELWPLVWRLLVMGGLYVGGATIYATKIPERWAPGKFDYTVILI